jgi:hypothetical protein
MKTALFVWPYRSYFVEFSILFRRSLILDLVVMYWFSVSA